LKKKEKKEKKKKGKKTKAKCPLKYKQLVMPHDSHLY
jgi:hypothetical protein